MIRRGNHDVCAEVAEFLGEFALDVEVEVHQRGNHGGTADQRQDGHGEPAATAAQKFEDDAPEHYSPLRISAGSNCEARRNGTRLPTMATIAASAMTTGIKTKRGDAGRAEDSGAKHTRKNRAEREPDHAAGDGEQ